MITVLHVQDETFELMTTPLTSRTLSLPTPESTDALGTQLAAVIRLTQPTWEGQGLIFNLVGDLGAGKTSLTRAILRALDFQGPVKSPTFSLVEKYSVLEVTLYHFDFYRFEYPEEFEEAGFRDYFGPRRICLTEWASRAEPYAPSEDITITLKQEGLGRVATLVAKTALGEQLLAHLGA